MTVERDQTYIVASLQDWYNAVVVGEEAMQRTVEDLHETTVKVLKVLAESKGLLQEREVNSVGEFHMGFNVDDVMEACNLGLVRHTVREHLNTLFDFGFVGKKKEGRMNSYWLKEKKLASANLAEVLSLSDVLEELGASPDYNAVESDSHKGVCVRDLYNPITHIYHNTELFFPSNEPSPPVAGNSGLEVEDLLPSD